VRREPIDEPLLFREHGLLPGVSRLAVGLPDRAFPLVEVVVARVRGDFAAVDLRNAGHDPVHELPIVRGHQQRAGLRLQKRLEPDDRFDVEVVRGLVHEQDVGPAEQHARHGHAHLPAARQRADVAVDALVVEAEAVEHFAGLALERVAPEVLVLLLHFAEPGERPIHLVRARAVRHGVVQRFELVMQVADPAAARDRLVDHRSPGHLLDVLPEVSDRQLPRHGHLPLVRRFLADDHPEERGLAGAIRTDEPDLLAWIELEGGVDEEDLAPVLFADAGERNHGSGPSVARAVRRAGHLSAKDTREWAHPRTRRRPTSLSVRWGSRVP
jgi:hypothetical protein